MLGRFWLFCSVAALLHVPLGSVAGAATATNRPTAGSVVFAADRAVHGGGAIFPDLYLLQPNRPLRQITHTTYSEVEPAASPDGTWIAFFAPTRGLGVVH